MYRSLLVPLAGSSFGEHALPFAVGIARRANAAVQLLHVHTPLVHATGIAILDSGSDERAKDQEWTYLDKMVRRWTIVAPEVRMSTVLLEGFPPEVLREQMIGETDLVVMATHGRGPASRFWMGSVADALVRTAAVPLLLLRLASNRPRLPSPLLSVACWSPWTAPIWLSKRWGRRLNSAGSRKPVTPCCASSGRP